MIEHPTSKNTKTDMIKTHIQLINFARKTVYFLFAVLFLSAVYAIIPLKGNHIHAIAQTGAGLNKGAMVNFVFSKTPKPVPDLSFKHGSGQPVKLSQWRGKTVLLNLWATWCKPCREEMPDLNKLQISLGGDDFEVVAVSIDRKGAAASQKFLDEIDVKSLALYVDETGKIYRDVRGYGLPVTLLIDPHGMEIGRLVGPADWASKEAQALIKHVIASGK